MQLYNLISDKYIHIYSISILGIKTLCLGHCMLNINLNTQRNHENDQEKKKLCEFKLPDTNQKQLHNIFPENESVYKGAESLGCDWAEWSHDNRKW